MNNKGRWEVQFEDGLAGIAFYEKTLDDVVRILAQQDRKVKSINWVEEVKKYIITYQCYEMFTGRLIDEIQTYKCKDGNDYKRCVDLYHEGKINLLTVNGKPIQK